jgi:hypothetical protein
MSHKHNVNGCVTTDVARIGSIGLYQLHLVVDLRPMLLTTGRIYGHKKKEK